MEGFFLRTKLWGGVSLLASIAASVGAANAADLAVKAPVYKAPPVILSDWSGFYIGINGGGGWADNKDNFGNTLKASGGLFGGQLGYNWQFGSFVAGVEADIDGADISKTTLGTTVKTNELGSVRARAGYVFLPNLLAYGTGGFAYGRTNVFSTDVGQDGWAAGAGLEYKVWGPLIARVEYLHYGLEGDVLGQKLKTDVDTVRGGLSYKF
jgi:outer membrane immunogenic protein